MHPAEYPLDSVLSTSVVMYRRRMDSIVVTLVFVLLFGSGTSGVGSIDDDLIYALQDSSPQLLQQYLTSHSPGGLVELGNVSIPEELIVNPCSAYMREFSRAAANFTQCFVSNARPLTACLNCVETYLQAERVFHALRQAPYKPGVTCEERLLTTNQTQIVLRVHDFIVDTWTDYHCQNCFSYFNLNDSATVLSNETVLFFKKTNTFGECLFNISVPGEVPIFITNMTVNVSACRDCIREYQALNDFYANMQKQHKRNICVDLVASINNTRRLWNENLHCEKTYSSIRGSVILCSLLACLPVVFYISNKVHGTKLEQTLLKQKRYNSLHYDQHHQQQQQQQQLGPQQPQLEQQSLLATAAAEAATSPTRSPEQTDQIF